MYQVIFVSLGDELVTSRIHSLLTVVKENIMRFTGNPRKTPIAIHAFIFATSRQLH